MVKQFDAPALENVIAHSAPLRGHPHLPSDDLLDSQNRLRILMLVEGLHDVEFLKRISMILRTVDTRSPDLAEMERAGELVFIPTCGNPSYWIERLSVLKLAEFHLLDRETSPTTESRLQIAAAINKRERCRAFVTRYRSLENYLHPAAIEAVSRLKVQFRSMDDVPAVVGQAIYEANQSITPWRDLSPRARKRFGERAKKWLNTDAVAAMTFDQIAAVDPDGEVVSWLAAIAKLAQRH